MSTSSADVPQAARRIRRVVTDRRGGAGAPPYDTFNLATHVGDDPAAVTANRRRLARELGVEPDALVWMEQVHGRAVTVVVGPQAEPVPMSDALVTAVPGLVLGVLVADCVPVLLWEETAGVAAVAHAGRRGLRLDIVAETVRTMVALGAEPERIGALLGPAIAGPAYEVPADMQADVEAHAPGSATRTPQGTPALDLRAGLLGQLAAAGVRAVAVDQRSTAADPTLFSHRRDGPRTGRQAGLVWIT